MATKTYVSLNKLSVFLDNLKNLFATKDDLGNKASQTDLDTLADTVAQKAQVQIVTWGADD